MDQGYIFENQGLIGSKLFDSSSFGMSQSKLILHRISIKVGSEDNTYGFAPFQTQTSCHPQEYFPSSS